MHFNKKVLFKVTESINYCLITGQGDTRLRISFTLHSTHKVLSVFTYFGVNVSIFCFFNRILALPKIMFGSVLTKSGKKL